MEVGDSLEILLDLHVGLQQSQVTNFLLLP